MPRVTPRQHDELAARVGRVLDGTLAAQKGGDVQALNRLKVDAWQLMFEITPMLEAGPDVRLADMLFEVAQVNALYQVSLRDWDRLSASCTVLGGAVTAVTHGISHGDYGDASQDRLRRLLMRMTNRAELAAYAAHQSGSTMEGIIALEAFAGILFEILMTKTAGHMVSERARAGLADVRPFEESARQASGRWRSGDFTSGTRSRNSQVESAAMASLPSPGLGGPFEQFYFAGGFQSAVMAARGTGRSILYIAPGFADFDGVAIRLNHDAAPGRVTESMLLPGMRRVELDARLPRIRDGFQASGGDLRPLVGPMQEILDWTGASVWDPIAARWPDLLEQPVAVIPVSRAALLPLYTATFRGEPACTQLDLTFAPTGRSLHFAALGDAAPRSGETVVAADPWHGSRELFQVEREATAIAGVYGTEPLLYRTAASGAAAPNPDIVRRLQTATVAHLACHGLLRGEDASLCLGGEVPLWHVLGVEGNLLPGRPLVVLSACELGGFVGEDVLAEQHGFPAGLLAIGARAVVGALWPLPDSRSMVWAMESFHRHLADLPSTAALPEAIREARDKDGAKGILTWGSLIHFGA
jgi:hypothetical protein